jgi:hypothetical protein
MSNEKGGVRVRFIFLQARVPARGTPTMDAVAPQACSSMVGVPLAGTLLAAKCTHHNYINKMALS